MPAAPDPGETGLATYAEGWAQTVLRVLGTPWPYVSSHMSLGPDDVDVTPERLHPAFHASLDWHSSCHMQWSAIRLLTLAAEGRVELTSETRDRLVAELDARLTEAACATEAAYLLERPGFERPYGWGWAAALAAAAADAAAGPLPEARGWAAATRPLFDAVCELVLAWLPKLAYPVRHGEHSNTAFGLALVHEAAGALDRPDVADAIAAAAVRWYAGDRDYPARFEPSGSDFLSPALCEADLMRRVLPRDELAPWLAAFLPGLGGGDDPLLAVPRVLDRTDGKAVHLFGLGLSRAWQLRLLASHLRADAQDEIAEATAAQVSAVEREIVEGDFMSTHWLVSFALLAATAAQP
jgi:hypothetical protein